MYSRKVIISVSGVILFLLAGFAAMFIMPAESPNTIKQTPQPTAKTQEHEPEPIIESPPKVWYVYVTGAVNKPGVYKLSEDSRVFQAIESAGGFTANADQASLNLAELLADEAHVHVSMKTAQTKQVSATPASVSPQTKQARAKSGLIDVNRADSQELQMISGIGPSIAQRIIDYRNAHGSFTKIDDLMNVKGIGKARLEQIRQQITLHGTSSYTLSTTSKRTQQTVNSGMIDVNHATLSELQRISGVGPAIAQRIIDYRKSHGSFSRVEDLLNVKGIGAAKLNQIRSQVVIR